MSNMSNLGLDKNYDELSLKDGEQPKIYKFYEAHNTAENKEISLKVLNKKNSEEDDDEIDTEFFLEQMKNEKNFLKEFDSDYIIKFYNEFDNNNYYILELEYFDTSLRERISGNPPLETGRLDAFKKYVITLVNALKELKKKNIIHRNIKPDNIFVIESDDDPDNDFEIKLGNFDCAIYKKDAKNSKPMGTILYSAPEIIKNLEYDEKSDYWSLGIVLFELYFGCFPFDPYASVHKVKRIIEGKEDFIYRKSYIPTLDVLFKRLLCINPSERMSFEELCDFIENKNFLKKDYCFDDNEKYREIYEKIKLEEQIEYPSNSLESFDPSVGQMINEILNFFKTENYSGNIKMNDIDFEPQIKFNNIIYYDEINDKNFQDSVYSDCEIFEQNTPGTFIFCDSIKELELINKEIREEINNNKEYKDKYKFNLITSGKAWENIHKYYKKNQDFQNIIKNVCIYCKKIKDYDYLSKEYDIVKGVWCTRDPIINFIKKTSSKEIVSFPMIKLVTYESYKKDYKLLHRIISYYYDEFKQDVFTYNSQKVTELIDKESRNKKLKRSDKVLKKSFKVFDGQEEVNRMKLIIEEYTKETFYKDLNSWQSSLDAKYYLSIAYFTARLNYCLNKYGNEKFKDKNEIHYLNNNNKIIYRGMVTPLKNILPYKRALNKVIVFPAFTSTSQKKEIGYGFAERERYLSNNNNNKNYSVLFIITNIYKSGWISNGIDIQDNTWKEKEAEILFPAFSFFYVDKVKIDMDRKIVDIYLKTVGKKCILEEEIRKGKDIEYNKKENIIQVKK